MITTYYDAVADALTCVFQGKMDSNTSQAVAESFETAWQAAQTECPDRIGNMTIIFDLARVDFIASAFLRLCLQAAKKAGEDSFRIVNTLPPVKKLFAVAGLDHLVR